MQIKKITLVTIGSLITMGGLSCSKNIDQQFNDIPHNMIRYVSIEKNFELVLDLTSKSARIFIPEQTDIVLHSYPFKTCENDSPYLCIFEGAPFEFAVPKNNLSVGDKWNFKDKKYTVTRSFKNAVCSDSYQIETTQNDKKNDGFIFDYDRGVMVIYRHGAIAYIEDEELNMTVAEPQYRSIFFATPFGVLGRNPTCS